MTHNNSQGIRAVRTTILKIDREVIDWELLRQNCYVVRYDMPYQRHDDKHYYPRMHNWYKQNSDFPSYLHTFGPHLYVKYGHPDEVVALSYQKRPLRYSLVNLQDENMFPWIMKLLVADFFQVDGRFVSNANFFLWATADKDFVTGLEIKVNHNWRESDDEFVIADQAARLRKLRPIDFERINQWKKVYYGRFYAALDIPVFKQLKSDQITHSQLEEGIYELFQGSPSNRASLTFHSVKSLSDLQQTRSYLLNQLIDRFVAYLNGIGLSFQQKLLQMWAMHTKSANQMQERQLPIEPKPINIVDDRLIARRQPDDFTNRFCEVANAVTADHDALFVVKAEANLQPGDWVLRIQDYDGDEFDSETGLLKDWQDTKIAFYARYPAVIKQTLNINANSKRRQKDTQRKKPRTWSVDEYLDYRVPTVKDIKTQLDVCRNQLLLKDVVMFPEHVRPRLPQVDMMGDMIFLHQQALVYFDGHNLHFMTIINNLETVSTFIQTHAGWDLMNDVLMPSAKQYRYKGIPDSKDIEAATKRPFIIAREFVWEIWEGNGRVVHEDDLIRERLEALENPILTKRFYPSQPIEGNSLFTAAQLQAYAQFLDQHVRESTISYLDLKKRYGKHIRDERGMILVEDGGFFGLLGIQNDTRFKSYLREHLGLTFESVREDRLFPVYKGIWYAPETNHYVAGVKDSNLGEQERGHALRRIVVHKGERKPNKLRAQLAQTFFPLLEVNFIRYRNYTVMPFPFRLIEMWQNIDGFNQA